MRSYPWRGRFHASSAERRCRSGATAMSGARLVYGDSFGRAFAPAALRRGQPLTNAYCAWGMPTLNTERPKAYARKTSEFVDQGLFIVSTASSGYTGQPRERARCPARRRLAGAAMHAGAAFLESGPHAGPATGASARVLPRRIGSGVCSILHDDLSLARNGAERIVHRVISQKFPVPFTRRSLRGAAQDVARPRRKRPQSGARSRSASSVYSSRQGTTRRPDSASSLWVQPSAVSEDTE